MSDTSMQCLCGGTICAAPGSWHEPHSCGVPPDHVIPDGIYETASMGRIYETASMGRCDRCGAATTATRYGDPRGETDDQERVELAMIVMGIVDAILDPGPQPLYHRQVLQRHRTEWPALWRYLDALCVHLEGQAPR